MRQFIVNLMFYADPQWTKSLKNQHCDPDRTLQTDIRPFAHGKYSTIILAYVTQNSVIMSGQLLASSDILSGNLKILLFQVQLTDIY